jgi:H+/Cl- antiporter ClcA
MDEPKPESGPLRSLLFVPASVVVGLVLGAVTKLVLWFLGAIITALWEWLPRQLDVDPGALPYLVVLLGTGGLLVGLGNRFLGYHPEPLDTVMTRVKNGGVVEHKTIPQTLLNTVAALGFGGPLGPEAALVATIGGLYYWVKESLETAALELYRHLRSEPSELGIRIWRSSPAAIIAISLIASFWLIPGGVTTAFVPESSSALGPTLLLGFLTGLAGGALGMLTARVEVTTRSLRFFRERPYIAGIVGGLIVAIAASQSTLVLFSGADQMSALFDGSVADGELFYASGAKWLALMVVFAAGWKGGPIFPLMFISGALAVATAHSIDADPSVMYAAGIAAAVAGAMDSAILGIAVALLVVPTSLIVPILLGAAAAALMQRSFTIIARNRVDVP